MLVLAGCGGQGNAVCGDGVVHGDGLHGVLHGQETGGVGHRVERHLFALTGDPVAENVDLLRLRRVSEGHPHEEPVELRLGQRVGALVLNGVGRGEHMEGPSQGERLTLDGDLPFLHRLEESRLGLRRRPVDLVGQQQSGEERTAPEREVLAPLVVDEGAGQVAGQEVRCELGAGELQAQRRRERPSGQRLPKAGKVLNEDVAAGKDGAQDQGQRLALSHDGALDLVEDALTLLGDLRERHTHGDSILSRTAARY
jgi:hypothetical protein